MTNALYILLIAFLAYIDLMCVGLMYSWYLWGVLIALLLVLAAALFFLIRRYRKHKQAGSAQGMRRAKTGIVLAMLLPVIPVIIVAILVAATLAIHG